VRNVLCGLVMETNSVLLRADVVSRRHTLVSVTRSSDSGVLSWGFDAEVRSGSLNSVLSGDTAKVVLRSTIGLGDSGTTIFHCRCLSNSLTINEVDIRSLVRELRALGSEFGSGVLGTEGGSLHAESSSSCLILKTSLIEAKPATGAVDAELGLGGPESEINLGPLVFVGSAVLGKASLGSLANSSLEATNSRSSACTERSKSLTSTNAAESLLKAEIGAAGGNDGVAQSARGV